MSQSSEKVLDRRNREMDEKSDVRFSHDVKAKFFLVSVALNLCNDWLYQK